MFERKSSAIIKDILNCIERITPYTSDLSFDELHKLGYIHNNPCQPHWNLAAIPENYIGSNISLILAIFAELFCASLAVLGLFTRLVVIPIIFMLIIAAFVAKGAQPLLNKELDFLYLIPLIVLLFCGPGRVSVDAMINR